jgi:PAS domain S-box-containing protein
VVVIATPCPLIIAIPVAIIGAISTAARRGVIVKDPAALELDGIVVIDVHGRIEAFNPAAERLVGYAEDEVLPERQHIDALAVSRGAHDTYLARHLATGVQKIIGIGREVAGLRRDGTPFPVHMSVGEMTVGGERKFTGE